MRSDGGKTTSSFLQSEFAPKDYFCGIDRLNGSFYFFMYQKNCATVSKKRGSTTHVNVRTYLVSFLYS